MADIQRMTITLPNDMAAVVKAAVDEGNYASTSEVVREALRDWKLKQEIQTHKLRALKAEIDRGMDDVAHGRVHGFSADRIVQRGRKLSAQRRRSA